MLKRWLKKINICKKSKNIQKENTVLGNDNYLLNGDNLIIKTTHITEEKNFYILPYEKLEKTEYSDNYFKYINKFKELENYLFNKLFTNYKKEKEFKSISLKFRKGNN